MPRDLFSETLSHRYAPKRSKWTIAGSFIAHVVALAVVLVFPVLSAFDNYVVQARNIAFVIPAAPVTPPIPAPPPKTTTPTAVPDLNRNAAPPSPPEKPVTREATEVPDFRAVSRVGPPGVPDGIGRPIENVYVPPPPVKRPPEIVRPGGNISEPKRVYFVEPVYPQLAIIAKQHGYVILEAVIDESGNVRDVKVLKGLALLDQAAIDAVRKWRYTPTRLNGVPVPIVLTVTVTFQLR